MLDQIQNFIKGTVSGTHDASVVTINVVDASAFPDPASGEYNLTWYDSTVYPDPADDPNVEIVRVTGRDTGADTLTVTRNQESSGASTKSTGGSTYMLILAPTKKTITDIFDMVYPIGSVYTNYSNPTNPGTLLGSGTWIAIEGEVVVGYKSGDSDFGTPSGAVGAKTHTLTTAELASHLHTVNPPITTSTSDSHTHQVKITTANSAISATSGADPCRSSGTGSWSGNSQYTENDTHNHTTDIAQFNSGNAGSGDAHNNIQPSRICYVWRRSA